MEELDSNLCMCVCGGKKGNKGMWRGVEGRGGEGIQEVSKAESIQK